MWKQKIVKNVRNVKFAKIVKDATAAWKARIVFIAKDVISALIATNARDAMEVKDA
jgi:hypothetical protein